MLLEFMMILHTAASQLHSTLTDVYSYINDEIETNPDKIVEKHIQSIKAAMGENVITPENTSAPNIATTATPVSNPKSVDAPSSSYTKVLYMSS